MSNKILILKILILSISFFLYGCSTLPGMHDPEFSRVQQEDPHPLIVVDPVLIPITPTLAADQRISAYDYRVAPADVLTISVWQHPEFNTAESRLAGSAPSTQGAAGQAGYLVNSKGYIYFPLVGHVHVAGLTVDEVRATFTTRLKKYVPNPQINVRVADFRGQKIYVFGEVTKPGFLPINDQALSITDALTLVGSIDPNAADPGHIYVIRGNFTHPRIYWLNARTPNALLLAEHFNLQPGDVLYVSSAIATRWNRILNHLLPSLQTIWYTKTITNS